MTDTIHLYQITDDLRQVLDGIAAEEGEVTPESIEALDRLDMQFERKAEAVGLFIKELEIKSEAVLASAQPIRDEVLRIKARATALANKANRLRAYLMRNMMLAEKDAIKGDLITVRVQQGPARAECDLTGERIPEPYRKTLVEHVLDRELVLRAHHQGEVLPDDIRVVRNSHLRLY